MLRGIRTASSGFIGKIIMTLIMGTLVVAFAVWGIADVFKGFGQNSLAKIGGTEISTEQFRQLYNERLQQIGRQFGRPLTQAQARAMGLDRQVLRQVLAETALDDTARRMGLTLSNAEIVKMISNDPTFKGAGGNFDPYRFNEIIRQAGYTEQRFINEQRKVSLRRQLADTVASGLIPPQTQLDALNRFQNETRNVSFVKLDASQAGTIETPSDEILKSYFEERKALFRAPEFRKVVVVTATPDAIATNIQISDEEAQKGYEQAKARIAVPERRQVSQLKFEKPEDAEAARAKIAAGASFDDVAKELNLRPNDVDLGLLTKNAMGDEAVANAAFALAEGEISQPVKSVFGTMLLKVGKIEPGNTPAFETVAPDIRRDLALQRARAQIQDLYNKMEDERGGGSPIAEAAQKLKLTALTIDAVDRSGRKPDGSPVTGLPAGVDVISQAFNSEVGIENDPVSYQGGYLWYEVVDVTRSRDRSFDEVRDQVLARWKDEEISRRLKAKADEIAAKIAKEGPAADLAAVTGMKVETATGLKRGVASPGLPLPVIDIAFATAKDSIGISQTSNNEWIVLRVTDINVPTLTADSPEAKNLRDNLQRIMTDEQNNAYIQKIEADIGTSINEQAFLQATGAAAADPQ